MTSTTHSTDRASAVAVPEGNRQISRGAKPRRATLTALALVSLACLALLPAAAQADLTFGPQGSAAGQTSTPAGLAVDDSTGDVFVSDRANKRIDVFQADGDFIRAFGWGVDTGAAALEVCTTASTCQAGLFGTGAGQFGSTAETNRGPDAIAVDNDLASPSYHDLYVFDKGNARVQRFTPAGAFVLAFGDGVNQSTGGDVCTAASGNTCRAGTQGSGAGQIPLTVGLALGLGGTVYVAGDGHVQKFDSTGAFIAELPGIDGSLIAADSAGNFYLKAGSVGIQKYDPAGTCLNCASPLNPSFNIQGLAVDRSSGEIFVSDVTGFGSNAGGAVNLYDSAGVLQSVIYGEQLRRMTHLAARSTPDGDFYAVHDAGADTKILHVPFEPPGPVVLPGIDADANGGFNNAASPIGNTKATLNARVNPEGAATTYHFEYISNADYLANGNSFAGSNPPISTAEAAVGSDFGLYQLAEEVGCADPQDPPQPSCLIPETTYHARVVATDGPHTATGPEFSFDTREPFEFGDTYSTAVGTQTATLNGELNPLNIAATGYFEYIDEATYQADKATGDGLQHATEAPVALDPPLDFGDANDSLTTRSTALSGLAPDTLYHYRLIAEDSFVTKPGPENAFHTFALPLLNTDCPNQAFRTGPSAALPDCRAYEQVSPADKQGGDIAVLDGLELNSFSNNFPASLEQSSPEGERLTYSSYRAFADPESALYSSQYLASRDPEAGWQTDNISPPRSGVPFYGHDDKEIHFQAFSEDLCSAWFLQDTDLALDPGDQQGYPDLYRRRNCDPFGYELLTAAVPQNAPVGALDDYWLKAQGFSADGSRSFFRANAKLTANATSADVYQLYVKDGANLRLLSVLPNGTPATTNSSVGVTGSKLHRFDSLDHAVSEDASRVYWTTTDATPTRAGSKPPLGGPGRLYVRLNPERAQSPIVAGECTDPARACTLPVSESLTADPAFFRKATPTGSNALFTVESGPLAGNLYSFELATETSTPIASGVQGLLGASEGLTRIYFVSTDVLAPGASAGERNLYFWEQGAGHAFVATLSGSFSDSLSYSPKPSDRFARVSPNGTRAVFMSDASLTSYDNADALSGQPAAEVYIYDATANGGAGELRCTSCSPSGARPTGRNFGFLSGSSWIAARIPGWEYALHASRVLSEDGNRLFFESFDALLPADTNGRLDIYQWEAPGSGDCDLADANYFEPNGGCLSLISSGQSPEDSSFVDASADGSDVFLLSGQQLFGSDPDTLIDIYDARVEGGFPPPPPQAPPCDLDAGACEGAGTLAPDTPGAGTPNFVGPGNPQAKPPKQRCPQGKRKVRRHGKVRCIKRHHKKRAANHNRGTAR